MAKFCSALRCRPENDLGLRLVGYDSSTVKLPRKRSHFRYVLLKNTKNTFGRTDTFNDTVAVQIGPINLAHIPFAPAHTPRNEKNGIIKRLIHEQTPPQSDIAADIEYFVKTKFLPLIDPLPPSASDAELRAIWNRENSYSAKRIAHLTELHDIYMQEHPDEWIEDLKQCKMFIKEEFYPEKKHPRLIISRCDTFKTLVGPFIHAFDHELFYGKLSKFFVKGKDSGWKVRRMQEIHNAYPLVLETDYSSFEGSQSRTITQAIEETVFEHFFQHHPRILELIKMTYEDIRFEVLPPAAIKKQIEQGRLQPLEPNIYSKNYRLGLVGNRKSGEMWTSSGNGLMNLVIMHYLADKLNVAFDGIVEGDDGFFGVTSDAIQPHHYAKLGFTIKLQYETDPNNLSFCGLRFARDGTYLIDPERLNRIGWSEKRKYFRSGKKLRLKLLKAKCLSLLAEAPNCPITSIFAYNVVTRIKSKAKFSDLDWWDRRILEENIESKPISRPIISRQARIDFHQMFGIGPAQQIAIENSFDEDWWNNFYVDLPDHPDSYVEGLVAPVSGHRIATDGAYECLSIPINQQQRNQARHPQSRKNQNAISQEISSRPHNVAGFLQQIHSVLAIHLRCQSHHHQPP